MEKVKIQTETRSSAFGPVLSHGPPFCTRMSKPQNMMKKQYQRILSIYTLLYNITIVTLKNGNKILSHWHSFQLDILVAALPSTPRDDFNDQ